MMNYMKDYKTTPNLKTANEDIDSSFAFSLLEEKELSPKELVSLINKNIQQVLSSKFNDFQKKIVLQKHERLNFACPYCGDSHIDSHKKRGNLYLKTFFYKCYNCGIYRNLNQFFKDFKINLNYADQNSIQKISDENINFKFDHEVDPSILFDTENLLEYGIERADIEKHYNLVHISKNNIYNYLQKRCQPSIERFSWNTKKEQLYIFNLIPETTKVIGFQIRNFKYKPKYMTFKLSKIYEELGLEITKELLDIDEISSAFGLLNMDLNKPITVFEGPLDSFLYKNSIATCSSNIDPPILVNQYRYFYDWDAAGRNAAMEKINRGSPVFLWKKLFKELEIAEPTKKMDLTDLLIMSKRNNIKLPKLSNFFSSDKYDIYWI